MTAGQDSGAFARFHPAVKRWVWRQRWPALHEIQELAAGPVVQAESDVIIGAPTASGKTEAAFLPIVSALLAARDAPAGPGARAPSGASRGVLDGSHVGGIEVLYVAPLKALINDQYDRLISLCEDTPIKVNRWHGDVASSSKQRLARRPEGILLITPESLEALFVIRGTQVPRILRGLRFIVVDELHSFIGSERGAQLQSLLQRVQDAIGRSVPRVGLSATLSDFAAACGFLRPGAGEKVTVLRSVQDGTELRMQLRGYIDRRPRDPSGPAASAWAGSSGAAAAAQIASGENGPDDSDGTGPGPEEESADDTAMPASAAIAAHLFAVLRGNDNLVFANSRAAVETLADRLVRMCRRQHVPEEFMVHHGSLSKELREDAEARLKEPGVPATAVCTSTLELGIDIGTVDCVAQIGPPPAVAAMRQRLGRSGRRGSPATLRLYVTEPELDERTAPADCLRSQTVQIIAMAELLVVGWYEPPDAGGLHLSTLIQQCLSMIAQHGGSTAAALYGTLCGSGPFRRVGKSMFAALLRDMGRAGLIEQDPTSLLLIGPVGERLVNHYSFYAAFTAGEEFRLVAHGRTLGSIPVINPLVIGSLLIFAGRRWKVQAVDATAKVIELIPSRGGRPPVWTSGAAAVHDLVRQRMRDVYVDTDIPVYLDGRARQLLAEGRSAFARLGLRDRHRVAWGNDTLLLPWRGDQIMNTLAAVVSAAGAEVGQDGVALTVHLPIDELDQILLQLRNEEPPAPEDLAKAVTNLAVDKYDQFLSEDLARRGYAARSLDVPGTWSFLRELDAEIYSGSRSRDSGHAIGIAQVAQDAPDPGAVPVEGPRADE